MATTDVPKVPLGTLNVQLNVPVALVVNDPLVQVETVTPSKTRDASAVEIEKPVPATVTVAPIGPCPGVTVIAGVVTVKAPVASCPPKSVAVTVVPDVPEGTLNTQLNAPVAPVVSEPLVQLEMVTPSKTSDASAVDTEKPVPDTVTVAPSGPCPGVTVIDGVVSVNVPVASWPPTSVAVTVVPEVPLGTLKVQLKAPVPLDVSEPVVQLEIVIPSKTRDARAVETEKPVPATVTVAPIGPCPGVTVIAGVVTVNAPVPC